MKHDELGDIAIQVGAYKKGDQDKKRNRHIGKLMRTEYDDGGKSYWIRLNADVLSPSLLIISRAYMEKGSDSVLLSVFSNDKKDAKKPDAPEPDGGEGEAF